MGAGEPRCRFFCVRFINHDMKDQVVLTSFVCHISQTDELSAVGSTTARRDSRKNYGQVPSTSKPLQRLPFIADWVRKKI